MAHMLRKCLPLGRRARSDVLANISCTSSPFCARRLLHDAGARLQSRTAPLAFAFDIDGVLLQGEDTIPAARRALAILDGENALRMKIPYILVTNGGGKSEVERCRHLTRQLGYSIKPTQIVQAHTVLTTLAARHAHSPVLVLGGRGDEVRKVAQGYGFNKVFTPLDILAWNPAVWPFHDISDAERASTIKADFADPSNQIRAVFVFHDPRNWALDIQILADVLQNHYSHSASEPIELVFCNPDLLWRSDFPRPRLGQGGFRVAFQAVFKALTGAEYPYVQYGKPTKATYDFAERVLRARLEELSGAKVINMPPVYMVGDNPESDIAGANAAAWSSVLVHTGVYDPALGPPTHTPTIQAADVEEAVKWAVEKEFSRVGAR
ncbi:hypothetical protein PLICRDRAFT_457454 [Plicaturopsis crispa FD-325 SS-3]|nr:hypothetical protein PLICRDRAFT_457454 [Plicaturopsis crispa FD-325 SS-3]